MTRGPGLVDRWRPRDLVSPHAAEHAWFHLTPHGAACSSLGSLETRT